MAINEKTSERLRKALTKQKEVEEKKMFGGLCFMVNGKMCVCVRDEELMFRIDPKDYESVLEKKKARPMIHNGNLMKGFVFVKVEDVKPEKEFGYWIGLALDYNKTAKVAKKSLKRKVPAPKKTSKKK
ncbi:TfoX/Sxy family protein [Leptospira andrefontaineae]|uniref:TfoX family protein n=1 Tax=Leptospira andrefontaineae TaxID=2484976 RepID=A0A4R9GWZ6_9LEPT|nr:TfoX/Sxy family protein [Leptospira andrefontaineae]TGK35797.1 TfoX family protein [Leptospira andrefontaineae]